jgi:DNA-binding MarR family transcriptional regulator/N-acetylglutamate synthase-like GNAT family acetyltransferase
MDHIARVRRFNRYYSAKLGGLNDHEHEVSFTMTEAQVLHELAQRTGTRKQDRRGGGQTPLDGEERRRGQRREGAELRGLTAKELAELLQLDPGYLSRILKRFEARGLMTRAPSEQDKRQAKLHLTMQGREAYRNLDKASRDQVADQLDPLSADDQEQLVAAMATIETLLEYGPKGPIVLRPHAPGDMGWIVESQARMYSERYKWGKGVEGVAARIVADFLEHFKPGREACWVAERDGKRLGTVLVVERTPQVAQLRLLAVLPAARGFGLGSLLVKQCEKFARQAGYEKIYLWTQTELASARKIYQAHGYRKVEESVHTSFGQPVEGESWVLDL